MPVALIPGHASLLLVADHAARAVPPGLDLGVDAHVLDTHVAVDLGVAELTAALAVVLDAPAILGVVSRLVVDLNRPPEAAIPVESDGIAIPGNRIDAAARAARLAEWHAPYHGAIEAHLDARPPRLIVSVHSFTPALSSRAEPRPWPVGILYNEDDRAARIALPLLRAAGLNAGDNQPYSGRDLNYTMDRHAEARGLPYLGIEVRQDQLGDAAGVARWAAILEPVIRACA
ncbi:N-formylglutamate amidohydrolase [Glacieibacterium frigidum]|uniref:N-formylglutamate amidohydrolase n=1 Tax=Glacieibacterium frigidum TaxID=2593303 RepID=A0A552UI01_9SPHN|nr:N-formylglutamate amidohydrolase [Glacieibacterium frigidum]TRW17848.1 N-formylglutamate amidohydrolase [Glacieibacterium frigidum]